MEIVIVNTQLNGLKYCYLTQIEVFNIIGWMGFMAYQPL